MAGGVRIRPEQDRRRLVWFGCLPTHQAIELAGPVVHAFRAYEGAGGLRRHARSMLKAGRGGVRITRGALHPSGAIGTAISDGRQNFRMPLDPQPVLCGRGLRVRPLRAGGFDALYEVARDPLVWAQHPDRDRRRQEVFEGFFAEALESGGALAVIADGDGMIGSSRFHGYDEQRGEVEIGWTFLLRSHWVATPTAS